MTTKILHIIGICSLLMVLSACNKAKNQKLFVPISEKDSGISFSNNLIESDTLNYFLYKNLYNGGGVAIGDINNDGLQDIYFTGNMVPNKLYLNKGNLHFEDISELAGVSGDSRWMTGATMADVNQDGFLDIYVSVAGVWNTPKNILYLNDGNKNGVPTFTESAESLGVADLGNSTQATFFDYDLDGDLDLYVANYPVVDIKTGVMNYRFYMDHVHNGVSDHLYKNENGLFIDVTEQAGVLSYGLSLGASVADFNDDGWPDLYVSNDFATPDYFYLNNGDGTFSEHSKETTSHTSFFGMGIDAADINNDGLMDFLQLDMTPEDNFRSKANMGSMDIPAFWAMVNNGMHYQYMKNSLQLNNGNNSLGQPQFSEISKLSNLALTDWSWAPLIADFDNDGWKDIFISNGSRRELNNKDFFKEMNKDKEQNKHLLSWVKKMPEEKIPNYAFKNKGGIDFENIAPQWGLDFKGWTTGASYADLDNDGDLDIVINNVDQTSMVYENHSTDRKNSNSISIVLNGSDQNKFGIGSKVSLYNDGKQQYQELNLSRGFQSSVAPTIHFGLGKNKIIDSLRIQWQDGSSELLKSIEANKKLTISHKNASKTNNQTNTHQKKDLYFKDITDTIGLSHRHEENYFDDFEHQILLPHKMSQFGPALAVGDINADGLDDFYVGGAKGFKGEIFMQKANGTFKNVTQPIFEEHKTHEDVDAIFFDADGDNDLDLYIVSGGNEWKEGDPFYRDRLYENNGKGLFTEAENALPLMHESGSVVKHADIDGDGDQDLFVGSRLLPRKYPLSGKSYILRNDSRKGQIKFTDITMQTAPKLSSAGMVTDAIWADIDTDADLDLILTGEWMPITIFINTDQHFSDETESYNLQHQTGWWNCIDAQDYDGDGDLDLVAGNLGENYKYTASKNEPFSIYVNDYDKNGAMDIVLSYIQNGEEYPLRGKQCSSQQIPVISIKFKDYNSFAKASLADVYSKQSLLESKQFKATNFATSYFENKNGTFKIRPLEKMAQISSVNSIHSEDINGDGILDLILAGNLYGSEIETPRNDASYGLSLLGDGKGFFVTQPAIESGLLITGEVRQIKPIKVSNRKKSLLIGKNNSTLTILDIDSKL